MAGLEHIDIPMFWKPSIAGMRVIKQHPRIGLSAKAADTLWASPELSGWLERHKVGKELSDPRHAFRKLVERLMPDYFTVLGGRYGVDVLLAESRQSCDLAFLAANWRYTHRGRGILQNGVVRMAATRRLVRCANGGRKVGFEPRRIGLEPRRKGFEQNARGLSTQLRISRSANGC